MATRKNPIILDEAAESVGGASPVDAPAIFDAPSAVPDEPPAPQKMSGASRFLLWSAGGLASALLINAVWGFVLDMMARGTIWGQVALAIVGLFFRGCNRLCDQRMAGLCAAVAHDGFAG